MSLKSYLEGSGFTSSDVTELRFDSCVARLRRLAGSHKLLASPVASERGLKVRFKGQVCIHRLACAIFLEVVDPNASMHFPFGSSKLPS